MSRSRSTGHPRAKAALYALLSLTAAAGLFALSRWVVPDTDIESSTSPMERPADNPVTTQPSAGVPPQDTETERDPTKPVNRSAEQLGALLLLFSMVALSVSVIFLGWIAYDIRRSRPAWKKQTRYPKHR